MRLIRGRMRKSSSGRISCHSASTWGTLVKKRWPPMSKRHPSRSAVRLMPPTTLSASSTVTSTSCLPSSYAAVRPAGPAPTTTTWRSEAGSSSFGIFTFFLSVGWTRQSRRRASGPACNGWLSGRRSRHVRPGEGGNGICAHERATGDQDDLLGASRAAESGAGEDEREGAVGVPLERPEVLGGEGGEHRDRRER